ncbi:olfactory receptor 11A1-like [Alligator mississippiensis]|uniref:olfactory receptor 11A1-like n=1 Tax=Alligator mississippiensis TaxID=8496 RepID=UPI00287773D4|nr:olfactory receptor 11A1-like [Alligator mississippiensis]
MTETSWRNQTFITEFILLGFRELPALQIPLFLIFLLIYIVTMAGNILIVVLVVADQNLHTPMYFFLGNLSCLETCYTSTILPRMLASSMTGNRSISIRRCFVQYFSFVFLGAAECYLLSVMSYDRYLAICKPLHYAALMNIRLRVFLAIVSWVSGFLASTITTVTISQLSFCGPSDIDDFLCDSTPIIKLSCSDAHLVQLTTFTLTVIFTLPPFLLTLFSYIFIISAILRIPSTTGRQKTFSTFSSHLIVVTMFYGTLIFIYILPKSPKLSQLKKVFSLLYTVVTPMVNPLVYSLRNKMVKESLRNMHAEEPDSKRFTEKSF